MIYPISFMYKLGTLACHSKLEASVHITHSSLQQNQHLKLTSVKQFKYTENISQ